MDLPRIGISMCLLGKDVRYNAGHKLDYYIKDILGKYVEFVPICPEVEAGFGVPREPMSLVENSKGIRLITKSTNIDLTDNMNKWIDLKLSFIESQKLCGFILKSKSPSCGVFNTKIFRKEKPTLLNGRGLFANALISRFPYLIIEEESRLRDPLLRYNFIQSIFIYSRWLDLASNKTVNGIMEFHKNLKYVIMANSPRKLKEMGHLVAHVKKDTLEKDYNDYFSFLIEALKEYSDIQKNRYVLEHIMDSLKKQLTKDEKSELNEKIENYAHSLVPILVPITLINHFVRKYDSYHLKDQIYLNPSSMELMLKNHV